MERNNLLGLNNNPNIACKMYEIQSKWIFIVECLYNKIIYDVNLWPVSQLWCYYKIENKPKEECKDIIEMKAEFSKRENKNNTEKYTEDTNLCWAEEENKKEGMNKLGIWKEI